MNVTECVYAMYLENAVAVSEVRVRLILNSGHLGCLKNAHHLNKMQLDRQNIYEGASYEIHRRLLATAKLG